ncbi:hypothetical protein BC833DRAFT_564899 [Globomyces pollinis-pini]|nr:hypothetical protein BC833DRAFT_564899 [Globomyces pollinis-pini]
MIPEAQLAWKKVNLPELQKQLDVQSLQLFSTQTASLESRKKLAEFTREFKKNPNPEGPEIKALLKLYQNEIDSINKRSKAAESAFLNLYKVLAEVPGIQSLKTELKDPCPVFELTIDQQEKMTELDSLKQENKKLKEDLEQSKNSTATTKLLEADIINLQKKLEDAEVLKDTAINEKVMEITTELKQEMEDKIHVFKETEHSLNRQLSHLKV